MLRGWEDADNRNPFDDDDESSPPGTGAGSVIESPIDASDTPVGVAYEPPPPPPPLPPHHAEDPIMLFRSPEPPAQPPSLFREWDAANKRYEEERAAAADEEIVGDDPLALSPGSMSVGDSLGGWSLGPGMLERKSVAHPYDVEEDSDDDGDSKASNRSSSPRTGCCKRLGLSMVKEDDEEEANSGTRGASGTTMFDDVDLEAHPNDLPTAGDMVGSPLVSGSVRKNGSSSSGLSDRLKRLNDKGSSLAHRAFREFQSNPNFKFRAVVALTVIVVFSCLLAVIVAAASNKNEQPVNQEGIQVNDMGAILDLMDARSETVGAAATTESPSLSPTPTPTTPPTESPSLFPTWSPTDYPTTASPSGPPTNGATTYMPTYSPSGVQLLAGITAALPTDYPSNSPVTPSPTRDCNDDFGEFLTHNNKLRDCVWLDNGYNGAKSARKDLNCPDAEIGDACRYTCRLYNGCIEWLLESLPEYTEENDVSIGDPCQDKPGSFVSNGGVLRECSWIEEDPETAPVKKNLNCGTPNAEVTELGIMCPTSCAGYNHCARMSDGTIEMVGPPPSLNAGGGSSGGSSGSNGGVELVSPNAQADSGGDGDGDEPTPAPTTWSSGEPTVLCQDHEGMFLTHMGTLRQCRWLNRDDSDTSAVKKQLNCGITEIGLKCFESCPCNEMVQRTDNTTANGGNETIPLSDGDIAVSASAPTGAPTPFDALTKGVFDENNETLTLVAYADATVSQKDPDENQGDSKRLNVEYQNGAERQRQSLILFDLSFVAASFDTITEATLRLYSVTGSDTGGVILKKMASPIFDEDSVTWNTTPGSDGAGEPIISYVDTLEANTWYDADVTAAVLDAIENGDSRLGIRIVSEDDVGANPNPLYFGSRERLNEPPTLIVNSRTADPTQQPVLSPTYAPTTWFPTSHPSPSPIVALTCMNQRGTFEAHTGESQPCSWLESGNGNLKKAFNCETDRANPNAKSAAMFCQASCSAYNGCDAMHCEDMTGTYQSHTGWNAECSWLRSGNGPLKLEQNCGLDGNEPTELGKRCQLTCASYNGCDAGRKNR